MDTALQNDHREDGLFLNQRHILDLFLGVCPYFCTLTQAHMADDLVPPETSGYKAPEKGSLEKLKELDAQDESLAKWKENLLLKSSFVGNQFDCPFLSLVRFSRFSLFITV